jgi:hypothetical protein
MNDPDVFISHASENKDEVARPLAQALQARGWSVWLDELELTVGDSLTHRINGALARSKFGVVVLSPEFFEKEWPKQELAGLAAREIDASQKVILPVWHNIDRAYLTERMPVLADRLGALTSMGIEDVANKLSRALQAAGTPRLAGLAHEPMIRSVISESQTGSTAVVPATEAELEAIGRDRPRFWEYLLFAAALRYERQELEAKWRDHQLRLSRGERHLYVTDQVPEWIAAERAWLVRQLGGVNRVFSAELQERAFGLPGEPGDAAEIRYFASRVIGFYETMMDWAASLRQAVFPGVYDDVIEAQAAMVDQMVLQVRDFVDRASADLTRLPELEESASPENPIVIDVTLTLELADGAGERFVEAFEEANRKLQEDDY